ncbi:CbtA family protein [Thalassococcus sp. BH17M4-6]|uniref:CbtA family protein n=1 Tax=Thalassococcus sp. BH17M4-6 TaxID=3413148 RepID=UPI003BC99546
MLSRLVTSALFAGAAAGLLAALLQLVFVQPVLLHAELYESGALVHFGTSAANSATPDLGGFDPLRDSLSILFSMLVYSGYGMVLVALMSQAQERGAVINARTGLIWGIAGFIALHLAPAFSLPPEVPGVAAADLGPRQLWWTATVVTAGIGLWLIAFGRNWLWWGAAVVLLLAPHLVGAPLPQSFAGPVPTEIGAQFAARALGVGLAAWVMLGGFAAFFWERLSQPEGVTRSA